MENTPLVTLREFFQLQFDSIREELASLAGIGVKTLAQTEKTNGRVSELERKAAEEAVRVRNLEREVFRGARKPVGVVTKRDVVLVSGAISGTLGFLAAVVKWFPAIFAASQVAK